VTISLISKLYNGEKAQRYPKIEAYWDHAIGNGMVSHFLVSQLSLSTRGREFTAGILHDIGKLALLEHFTAAADVIDRRIQSEQCSDIQSELAIVGVPHTEIGGWIAEKWNLPASYIEVIRYHHVPAQALGNTLLASIIHIADGILQMRGVGLIEESVQIDINMKERWQILARVHPQARDVDLVQLITEIPFSIEDTRNFLTLISGRNGGSREA
jgi:HD-like signal output (HDOD) protein